MPAAQAVLYDPQAVTVGDTRADEMSEGHETNLEIEYMIS